MIYFIYWIEASLKLDYTLIMSDLVLDQYLELDQKDLNALYTFLKIQ